MIPFIMWSMAMMITGATIATWFWTKDKITSGSGVFTPPHGTKIVSVTYKGMGVGGGGTISVQDDIPKSDYAVEERYE